MKIKFVSAAVPAKGILVIFSPEGGGLLPLGLKADRLWPKIMPDTIGLDNSIVKLPVFGLGKSVTEQRVTETSLEI